MSPHPPATNPHPFRQAAILIIPQSILFSFFLFRLPFLHAVLSPSSLLRPSQKPPRTERSTSDQFIFVSFTRGFRCCRLSLTRTKTGISRCTRAVFRSTTLSTQRLWRTQPSPRHKHGFASFPTSFPSKVRIILIVPRQHVASVPTRSDTHHPRGSSGCFGPPQPSSGRRDLGSAHPKPGPDSHNAPESLGEPDSFH